MSGTIDKETADAAFKRIKEWEDFRPTIYSDPGGGQPALGWLYADRKEGDRAASLGDQGER